MKKSKNYINLKIYMTQISFILLLLVKKWSNRINIRHFKNTDIFFCIACGKNNKQWIFKNIISQDLTKAWKISEKQRKKFNQWESQFCPNCGNSTRTRFLARAIMNAYPIDEVKSLKDWVAKSKKLNLSIAEINSCGKLHKILSKVQNLSYSEYPSSKLLPKIYFFVKRVKKEDITNLTYPGSSFDLVIHSEVLEHIPDVDKALRECRRVLKPKGICLFTVPYISSRNTKQCAAIDKKTGKILHLRKPSFHGFDNRSDYMVWWEFGRDFLSKNKLKIVIKNTNLMTYVFSMKKYG